MPPTKAKCNNYANTEVRKLASKFLLHFDSFDVKFHTPLSLDLRTVELKLSITGQIMV